MNWEAIYREQLQHVFPHESGHAVMAVLQSIQCHGIFFERGNTGGRFCTIYALPVGEPSQSDYLVAAAGFAAESLFLPDPDVEGSNHDRVMFDRPGAPTFDATLLEAKRLLEANRPQLNRLKSRLEEKLRENNFDFSRLPEIGMDGSNKRFRVLINQQELGMLVSSPKLDDGGGGTTDESGSTP